jgi:hypothetical protein
MADPKLIDSPLSQSVVLDGETLQVRIYRLDREKTWTLEIVAAAGTSTVWEDRFRSDRDALEEALAAMREEGIEAFTIRTIH